MLAIIATEISLQPDWTVIVQLGVFLIVMAVLHIFIFKPILRIIDHRKKFTQDAHSEAIILNEKSALLEKERTLAISKAIAQINSERDLKISTAHKEGEKILASARVEAKRLLDATEVSVDATEQLVATDVERQTDSLAHEIAEKVAGK